MFYDGRLRKNYYIFLFKIHPYFPKKKFVGNLKITYFFKYKKNKDYYETVNLQSKI